MAIDFPSPSMRAAGGDLAIQVSPLGLIDISDEEFEVHGPRVIRYSNNWAWYLGHHWAYRAQAGEPQLTFNHVQALSNFMTNFSFGKGFSFLVDPMYQHILPALLDRVFSKDNNRAKFFWGLGQQGSVSGDVFVKIAYAQPGTDAADPVTGRGRVTLLNLQPSHCVDEQTEVLTRDGWKSHDQVGEGTEILTIDPETDEVAWQPIYAMTKRHHTGKMYRWQNERFDSLTTDGHRWMTKNARSGKHEFRVTSDLHSKNSGGLRIVSGGGVPLEFPEVAKYGDEWVELAGWFVTEGAWNRGSGAYIYQSESVNPEKVARIRRVMALLRDQGFHITEGLAKGRTTDYWYLGADLTRALRELCPDKQLTPGFLSSLTFAQANLLYDTLMLGDGHRRGKSEFWYQDDKGRVDSFQMLCAMLGKRTFSRPARGKNNTVTIYQNRLTSVKELQRTEEDYDGVVWCPNVKATTWLARRNGVTYWTGNCFPEWHPHVPGKMTKFKLKYKFWSTAPDGTRLVNTYVEEITDEYIKEWVNDELIRENPNPLGIIPVVHIANFPVQGSPWGLSDIDSIIPLNREYNEKATEISDILNYHASPVTVITGGKPPNLEKGPAKIWGIMNDKAQVFNLEGGAAGLPQALEYLDLLRMRMHEYGHVPANALGEPQPISNTSGVALAIQYMPTMQWHDLKRVQYGDGLKEICRIILKTLFLYEPETVQYDPTTDGILDPDLGQAPVIDPNDPAVYDIDIEWPPPLPVDKLITLEEIGQKLAMNLESRKGALRTLNEEFPDEKLEELRAELMKDAEWDAELKMYKSAVDSIIMAATGVIPEGESEPVPPEKPEPGANAGNANAPQQVTARAPQLPEELLQRQQEMYEEIVTNAFSPRVPIRRTPARNDNDNNDVV